MGDDIRKDETDHLKALFSTDEEKALVPETIGPDLTLDELNALLAEHGIVTSGFQKTVAELHAEVQQKDCFLRVVDGSLVRMVQPVFIKVVFRDRVLVNTKDIYVNRANKERIRNSLVSEKVLPGETPIDGAVRALQEELSLANDAVKKYMKDQPDQQRTQQNKMPSKSYDGLMSIYHKHLVVLQVQEDAPTEFLDSLGLPDFKDFETRETKPEKDLRHFWTWLELDKAYKEVTGCNFDVPF